MSLVHTQKVQNLNFKLTSTYIGLKNIFYHLLLDFAKCVPTCYVDQYLNVTYSPGIQYMD